MPYKDKEKQRAFQREWTAKKRRAKGIVERPKGKDVMKARLRKYRYRFGPLAESFIVLQEINKELNSER